MGRPMPPPMSQDGCCRPDVNGLIVTLGGFESAACMVVKSTHTGHPQPCTLSIDGPAARTVSLTWSAYASKLSAKYLASSRACRS